MRLEPSVACLCLTAAVLPPLGPLSYSGHTTAGTFVCGTLLFLLLPLALQAWEEQQREEQPAQELRARSAPQRVQAWLEEHRWSLWGSAALLTASGRVLADAHWMSDTIAGACLGAALTALTVQLCRGAASGGRL
jgi:membrane-associated phospholipid phosphatase